MTAPSDWLRYLPAIYGREPFVGLFLKVFQKLFTGIDDAQLDGRRGIQELLAAEVVGNLFYPRFSFLFPGDKSFMPPIQGKNQQALLTLFNSFIGVQAPVDPLAGQVVGTTAPGPQAAFTVWLNDFLAWLAGWIDLVPDSGWGIDKKRMVIAQMPALYRLRGTPAGIEMLCDLLFDLPWTVNGQVVQNGQTQDSSGTVSLEVANPAPPVITVTDVYARGQSFVLRDSYTSGMPVVSGQAPWVFNVRLIQRNPNFFPSNSAVVQLRDLLPKLRVVLDAASPALCRYTIQVIPGMRLPPTGSSIMLVLNGNTLLGSQEAT